MKSAAAPVNPALPCSPTLPSPQSNCVTIPIPVDQITFPGGDLSVVTNLEYRITIYGPVALAPFMDMGIDPIIRKSQLQIATQQYQSVIGTAFGCPSLSQTATANTCAPGLQSGPRHLLGIQPATPAQPGKSADSNYAQHVPYWECSGGW